MRVTINSEARLVENAVVLHYLLDHVQALKLVKLNNLFGIGIFGNRKEKKKKETENNNKLLPTMDTCVISKRKLCVLCYFHFR